MKRRLRWLIPLVVLAVVAVYFLAEWRPAPPGAHRHCDDG